MRSTIAQLLASVLLATALPAAIGAPHWRDQAVVAQGQHGGAGSRDDAGPGGRRRAMQADDPAPSSRRWDDGGGRMRRGQPADEAPVQPWRGGRPFDDAAPQPRRGGGSFDAAAPQVQRGGGVSRDEAAAIAQRSSGGRVLSVDSADAGGRRAWRVKVVTPAGDVRVVFVDQ